VKAAMFNTKVEEAISWVLGLVGGGLAYANIPALLHIDWSFILTKLLALVWAGGIAFFTGAMGWLGQKVMQKAKWFKKITNNKSDNV
jgi:uncharacterized membrane protein YGL010W